VEEVCRRSHGRRALRPVLALLPSLRPAPPTRSDLERDFLGVCRKAGLPAPQVNVIVKGFEVDALWPDQRLVVELDSFEFHRTRAAFERDRARDAALQLAGYRVLRITWRRLRDDPEGVVKSVRVLLGR
jgi:hypothetical protein